MDKRASLEIYLKYCDLIEANKSSGYSHDTTKERTSFAEKEWIAVEKMREWLKEEIHRAGAPSQMLQEFDKKVKGRDD